MIYGDAVDFYRRIGLLKMLKNLKHVWILTT